MNKEKLFLKIINETISDNSYLGDDCAYLPDLGLLVSQDTLIEGVHFKTDYFTPREIGKKAALVNVSDILAGGGEPKYMTVSLSGRLDEGFVKEFYKGLDEVCNLYNLKIIGGDLTGGEKITVSICITGLLKGKTPPSMKNAKPGDFVYLEGFHGSSAFGLQLLLKGNRDKENEFIKAHKEPVLYPEISKAISGGAKFPYVMTDTSDGLYDALKRVSVASGVGFEIDYDRVLKKVEDKNLVLFGGEDFGLLICLDPKDSFLGAGLNRIGRVTDSRQIVIDGVEIGEDKSYNHFG